MTSVVEEGAAAVEERVIFLSGIALFAHPWRGSLDDGRAFQISGRHNAINFPSGTLCVSLFTGPRRRCSCGVAILRHLLDPNVQPPL